MPWIKLFIFRILHTYAKIERISFYFGHLNAAIFTEMVRTYHSMKLVYGKYLLEEYFGT